MLKGFDTVLSDMLHFTSGVNDVELSLDLASTSLHLSTGYYFDVYGEEYSPGYPRHAGVLKAGGSLAVKIYEVRQGYQTRSHPPRVMATPWPEGRRYLQLPLPHQRLGPSAFAVVIEVSRPETWMLLGSTCAVDLPMRHCHGACAKRFCP